LEVYAHARNVRIAPRKVRLVVDSVRGMPVHRAMSQLQLMPQKAAREVYKAVKSAVANAENNYGLEPDSLIVARIWANEARVMKRWRPRAHGRVSPLLSRSSHITVVVDERRLS
jgi:large subunit ribosomal protein L22